jgi:hypothetical protein
MMESASPRVWSLSAIHRYFRFWCEQGFFKTLWVAGLAAYDEAAGIKWKWFEILSLTYREKCPIIII